MLDDQIPKRPSPETGMRRAGTQRTRKPKAERAQLTPEDWIAAAAQLLIHRSIDAVRVDVIAKILDVTRGSFYWHFKDRDDLLNRVLLGWQDEQTEQIIARYRKQGVHAAALIRDLVELPSHGRAAIKGASVELAIRAWARRDEMARRVVDAVDAKRLVYLEECFSELGFAEPQAKSRAFLLYCYMQSESLFRNQGSIEDKQQRQKFVADTLLAGH
ncbi:MAG TPA: TetR/AcrR family transcriptional regulator [Variovorax sp.]|nr:TetR/AcrR family transcriptional regulator [Variovorax sp.]